MTPADLLLRFRREMADTVEPYLWSDEEIIDYIASAHERLVRKVGGLADSTSSITSITVVPGTEWYAISPRILKIRKATVVSTGVPLHIDTPETADARGIRFRPGSAGWPKALVQGLEDGKLRLYPVPVLADTIALSVLRMPMQAITAPESEIEAPEQHHEHLLLWMKALAYRKQDSETVDKNRAADFDAQFENYCAQVFAELSRQRRSAGPVVYGGL